MHKKLVVTRTRSREDRAEESIRASRGNVFAASRLRVRQTRPFPTARNKLLLLLCAVILASLLSPAVHAQDVPPTSVRPLIFIRSFRTEPAVVQANETFRLFLELHNVGSAPAVNVVVAINSDDFVPQGSSSVKTIGGLNVDEHGWVWQDLRSEPDLTGGTYPVTINLSYQDDDGMPYASSETVGVNVALAPPTATPTVAPKPGLPQLVIENVTTQPATVAAGEPFTLTLRIRNPGTGMARRALLTVGGADEKNFAPTTGSNVVSVGDIGIGQTKDVSLALVADADTQAGRHTLGLELSFINWGDEKFTSAQNVALTVAGVAGAALTPQPQALPIIESYTSTPLRPNPGQTLDLRLNVRNVGSQPVQNLTIDFGTAATTSGTTSTTIFAPVGTGNVRYVPVVNVGETIPIDMQFIVNGTASAGTYVVPIEMTYDGPDDKPVERTEQITLLVSVPPQLRIDYYQPVGQPLPGMQFDVSVEVINQGRSTVDIGTVDLTAAELDIENGSAYVGPLEPSQSGTVDSQMTASAGGSYSILVTVHYVDDFYQNQVVTATLPLEVLHMEEPGQPGMGGDGSDTGDPLPEQPQRPFLIRLILGFLGLGSS